MSSQSLSTSESEDKVNYSVKIISPTTNVVVQKWEEMRRFANLELLRVALSTKFQELIQQNDFSIGFIQPGHGSKGRQIMLDNDEDLVNMYGVHQGRKQIVLWMKVLRRGIKRPLRVNDDENKTPKRQSPGNYQGHLQKMTEVQLIYEELEKHHGDSFTKEQLMAWAHMLNIKKHDSYNTPPKKPFFKKPVACCDTSTSNTLSPGKRISYRSECIDQLDKWHALLEKGAISKTQFEELQQTILGDIKKF